MAVQKCIYDNFGRCTRTVTDVWRDPPPGSGLSVYDGKPIPGWHAGFDIFHFSAWGLIVVFVTVLTFRVLRWILGTLDTGAGTLAMIPGFAFAAFVSMGIANLALDHGFRISETGAAFSDAVSDVQSGIHWLQGGQS